MRDGLAADFTDFALRMGEKMPAKDTVLIPRKIRKFQHCMLQIAWILWHSIAVRQTDLAIP